MKASQFFIATLKEAPADAEVISHKLMMRAGMIKRLGAGIYNYMPMGLRVIRKVEGIIREEMNRAGAVELLMPVVQPAELWQETGRFDKMGPELMRVKDRHERDFIIQPTSEEVVTDIARQELRSYKQLPKNFYHIQTKFRDERRPRFGIMRGREFTMKDAYSFDRSPEAAAKSYETMFAAYKRIFDRFGLTYRAVAADTGAIGGDLSHEFQVIAQTGEDAIIYCPTSDYAANIELAEAVAPATPRAAPTAEMTKTLTPGKSTCADVAAFLGLPLTKSLKSLVLATDTLDEQGNPAGSTVWLLLLRGDHEMNEVKVGKVEGLKAGFRFATLAEIDEHFGCKPGYLGPVGLPRYSKHRIATGDDFSGDTRMDAVEDILLLGRAMGLHTWILVRSSLDRLVFLGWSENGGNVMGWDVSCGEAALESKLDPTEARALLEWLRTQNLSQSMEPCLVTISGGIQAVVYLPSGLRLRRAGLTTDDEPVSGSDERVRALKPLKPVKIIADRTVAAMSDFCCGANEADYHLTGVNWGRDLPEPDLVADLRNVVEGDPSPDGQGVLAIERGIEVGHVFYLGTKYSKAMNATFLDETGKPALMEMGCYGIGVTRILGAAIEQGHDARGIIWPDAIAPFTVAICPIGYDRSTEVKAAADALHDELLAAGIDVMLDDRGERPGAMFADWELIGVPHRVVLSDRGLKEGQVEYQGRRDEAATKVPAAEVAAFVKGRLKA